MSKKSHVLDDEKWFIEPVTEDQLHVSSIKKRLVKTKSKFQKIEIVELGSFGKTLVLDNCLQSSLKDEYIYHESLVHPALLNHKNPKTVFIGGGGEGATLREVLKHKSVEKCVMVDIDEVVVSFCKENLKEWSNGGYDDKRTKLVIDDCKNYLEKTEEKFDVIIMDLADPVQGNTCFTLYTVEFYDFLKSKLNDGGIFITQSGPGGYLDYDEIFASIFATVRHVFKNSIPYTTFVPSFLSLYGFSLAFTNENQKLKNSKEIDDLIKKRIIGGENGLRFYDGDANTSNFTLTKPLKLGLYDKKWEPVSMKKKNFAIMYNG